MPQYPCPQCKAVLKREEPVPAGKKLRCPKCQTVFAPVADKVAAGKLATAPKPASGKPVHDDLEADRNPYAVVQDDEADEAMQEEKQRAAMGLVRDRFKKSARGPAMKLVVRPANAMISVGVLICVLDIVAFIAGLFPLVFSDFYNASSKPPPGMKYEDWEREMKSKGPQKRTPEQWRTLIIERSIIMGIATFQFLLGGVVCVGAFKMRTLESLGWSWAGAVACMLSGLLFAIVGIWAAMILSKQEVKDGFAEEKPPEV